MEYQNIGVRKTTYSTQDPIPLRTDPDGPPVTSRAMFDKMCTLGGRFRRLDFSPSQLFELE